MTDGQPKCPNNKLLVEDVETGGETSDNSVLHLNPAKMEELEFFRGDVIKVKGKRKKETVLIAMTDEKLDKGSVRLNKVARKNLGVSVGDHVLLFAENNIPYGSKVHLLPYEDTIKDLEGDLFDQFIKPYFLDAYRPLKEGDTFVVNGPVEFKVIAVDPSPCCVVSPETIIYLEGEPLQRENSHQEIYYEDIGGLDKELREIRDLIELPISHPSLYENIGIQPPRGVLLHGPTGTGKTLIAKAIAHETDAYFFLINGPEIVTKLAGESEKNLRLAFEMAEKNAPSIIFIDELDSLAPKRNECNGEVEKRVVSQLLTLMDGLVKRNVIVIGATNQLDSIDGALRRFGRFDREIELGIPDKTGRLEILRTYTKKMKLALGVDIDFIAQETKGYVGADLASLCTQAGMACVSDYDHLIDKEAENVDDDILQKMKVTNDHFLYALKNSVPCLEKVKNEEKKGGN